MTAKCANETRSSDSVVSDDAAVLEILSKHPLLNYTRSPSTQASCKIPLFSAFNKEILPYYKLPPEEIRCKVSLSSYKRIIHLTFQLSRHLIIYPEVLVSAAQFRIVTTLHILSTICCLRAALVSSAQRSGPRLQRG